jgi:uncharacterized protein (TIGR03435 family)
VNYTWHLAVAATICSFMLGVDNAWAQTKTAAAPPPTFEVASVRAGVPGGSYEPHGGPGTADPGRFTCQRVTLLNLLTRAYGVGADQISGPDWLATVYYSVTATIPPNTTQGQFNLMLQGLLAERFNLTLHHGTKEFPVYELIVARGGPKMNPSPPDVPTAPPALVGAVMKDDPKTGFPALRPGSPGSVVFGKGMVRSTSRITMAEFAANLGPMVNLSNGVGGFPMGSAVPRVVDKTGLQGKFDFTLEFAGSLQLPASLRPPRNDAQPAPVGPTSNLDGAGPNLFTALRQQLGLELRKGKPANLEVLVIDNVDRVPTEN